MVFDRFSDAQDETRRFEIPKVVIFSREVLDDRHDVIDRLGRQTGHGSRTDVLDAHRTLADCTQDARVPVRTR